MDHSARPATCALCGSVSIQPRGRTHEDSGIVYTQYACASCDAWFWSPMKNPGPEWYEKDMRYAGRNKDPHMQPNWNHRKVISFLAPMKGNVLDIGCGTGNFLYHARAKGWVPYGVDFDRDAVSVANSIFDLANVEVADVVDYAKKYPERKFDLITFFDLFEHIDNHAEFTNAVRGLLKDGGYIAMSMPYRHHADWLMRGDLPPRHLTNWDRSSLSRYFARNGFDIVYIAKRSEGLRYLIVKLRFMFGKRLSLGLVDAAKKTARADGLIKPESSGEKRVLLIAALAKVKDAIIFGIPALVIWLTLLPKGRGCVTLYCIAKKRS